MNSLILDYLRGDSVPEYAIRGRSELATAPAPELDDDTDIWIPEPREVAIMAGTAVTYSNPTWEYPGGYCGLTVFLNQEPGNSFRCAILTEVDHDGTSVAEAIEVIADKLVKEHGRLEITSWHAPTDELHDVAFLGRGPVWCETDFGQLADELEIDADELLAMITFGE